MTGQPIRQYPDEIREQAETDMLAIHPEPDLCRPVEIDGELLRVRGAHDMNEESRAALADVIRAVKRKYAAEHPEEQP